MGPKLAEFAKREYPAGKSDLFAMFIERISSLGVRGSTAGVMSPNVWMYIASYRGIRHHIAVQRQLISLVELPLGGFKDATVQICAFVFGVGLNRGHKSLFYRLPKTSSGPGLHDQALRDGIGGLLPEIVFEVNPEAFIYVPNQSFIYWAKPEVLGAFRDSPRLGDVSYTRIGLITGDNRSYVREWWEVSHANTGFGMTRSEARDSGRRWFPASKGGEFRKWYGNITSVINWHRDGHELQTRRDSTNTRTLAHNFNLEDLFCEGVTWSKITSGRFSARLHPQGTLFIDPATNAFSSGDISTLVLLAYLTSNFAGSTLGAINPTLNFQPGNIVSLPWKKPADCRTVEAIAAEAIQISRRDWDAFETSFDYSRDACISVTSHNGTLAKAVEATQAFHIESASRLLELERLNDACFSDLFAVEEDRVKVQKGSGDSVATTVARSPSLLVANFVSYAIGCMFGRYSLDVPGLVLADQGDSLAEYLARVPSPSFMPDEDNVLPVLSDGWFEDDVVERFRAFLKVSFGEEHFEENLRFVEDALGKDIRKYFVQDFYKDHVQRYKKRPIYWMFSSPKGSFNALIYMHRYRPDTVSVVLNDYLHEFQAKLRARRANLDQVAASTLSTLKEQTAARKESEQIRKMLLELEEWEQSVLYPLATEQIAIDLDDGVKANYPKFGAALKKIVGLEANE
jgi:hypothetical protein